jgi:hypothetical protein
MMVFTIDQIEYLRNKARRLLSDLVIRIGLQQKEEYQVDAILRELQEACSEGRAIALNEVSSSPWEMMKVSLYRDTGRGTRESAMEGVDGRLSEGWEPWQVCGPDGCYLLMRRRRAVAEIAAKENRE